MLRRLLLILVPALLVLPAPAALAQGDGLVDKPLYKTGPSGRWLMGGAWLFRLDPGGSGIKEGWPRQADTAGWTPTAVPGAWNTGDFSNASMTGGVGWYRKDFRLPSSSSRLSWVLRFESVNYRSWVYVNGREVGRNTGAYLPFEVRIPRGLLSPTGVNRLVVRVDSRRAPTDFPPGGTTSQGIPTGGWWNYSGILREVYLREVDGADLTSVLVRPQLRCGRCDATVTYRATVRNAGARAATFAVRSRLGGRAVSLGRARVRAGREATLQRTIRVHRPRLWSPSSPYLYDTSLAVASGGRTLQRYDLRTGIRSVKVSHGRLYLNGRRLDVRGFGSHEDSLDHGAALDNAQREQQIQWAREAGATMFRAHYPLHPYYYERFDELGMLAWVEVPVYSTQNRYIQRASWRASAAALTGRSIRGNWNHPSAIIWSIANELSSKPDAAQGDFIARAAAIAHRLDPTRPVGLAYAGYRSAGCQARYAPLDVLGVNVYFGWYPGPGGQIADRSLVSEYLDSVRRCYPTKAILITEFGAEANRDGPAEERGTFAFQSDWVRYQLGVYATKSWLSGALYWTLEEFNIRPEWDGGNPWPSPHLHQKAVITMAGEKKPAFFDLQRGFRSTRQYGG
jgi:beta-galactosidase/beta-glucuronidase